MTRGNGKHANIFKRPPAICLMCGPADKMKIVPKACIRCGFRAAADKDIAAEITRDIAVVEQMAKLVWEAVGRCLDDVNRQCPVVVFEKKIPHFICEGMPCELEVESTGEDIHPHFRCWAAWLGQEMAAGVYSPAALETRRVKMKAAIQNDCEHKWANVKGQTIRICEKCEKQEERE